MADVIIIRPISDSWPGEAYVRHLSIPHGPLVLAAHLIDKGHTVKIIDEIALEEIVKDNVSDLAKNQLIDMLKDKPICVGITSMTGEQIKRGKVFAEIVKKIHPDIPIVWGGAHPTLLPEMTLEDPAVDMIVAGEGDISFPILIEEMKKNGTGDFSKVPGFFYIDKEGKVNRTKPAPLYQMSQMPPLPYHLIDMETYITKIKKRNMTRFFDISSARGCPLKCTFCLSSREDYTYTKMDAERVVKEIETLVKDYGVNGISFNDENFIMNKKRLIAICESVIEKKLNITMRCGGSINFFLNFDDEVITLMKKAGFDHVGFGVESGSDITLKQINKLITVEKIHAIVAKMKKHGFHATYNFIGGFPNETVEEYKKTLQLIYHIYENSKYMIYPVAAPNYYYPFPGTKSYDEALKLGWTPPKSFNDWSGIDGNRITMPWLADECKDLVIKSRDVINAINQKYTGKDAVISSKDLEPLKQIMY